MTKRVTAEAARARAHGGRRIRAVPTGKAAMLAGAIRRTPRSGSDKMAAAHLAAVSAQPSMACVTGADPGGIVPRAQAVPGCRIVVRDPVRAA